MKNLTMSLTFAVAALAAAAGSASAQSYKAEIPMAFRAGGKAMAPGSYDLRVMTNDGKAYLAVSNFAAKTSALLMPLAGSDVSRAWRQEGKPKISFECVGGKCTLSHFWNGRNASDYKFQGPKLSRADAERVAVVTFGLTRTD